MASVEGFSADVQVIDTGAVSPTLVLSHDTSHYGDESEAGYAQDPVNTALGNFTQHHTDLSLKGRGLGIRFARFYNSQDTYSGPLGYGWTHSYNITVTKTGDVAVIKFGDGREEFYVQQADDSYTPQPGVYNTLIENPDGTFDLEDKQQTVYSFDTAGQLVTITDKNGNTIALTYTDDRLTTLTDPVGRQVELTYDGDNRITQLTDPLGRTITFAYDGAGDLVSATDAMGQETVYTYDVMHQMLTATDPNDNVFCH